MLYRRSKGNPVNDPFVTPAVNSKGKSKAQEDDATNREVAMVKLADGELEDEDDIVEDEPTTLSDLQGSGLEDDGKPFIYQEDLHKRR